MTDPVRIRIGAGEEAGFTKLDNPQQMPWKFDDSGVDEVFCWGHFHTLTQEERFLFMDEVWRVLRPATKESLGGKLQVTVPHWTADDAITDPFAKWPPLAAGSFMVYSRRWREAMGYVDRLPLKCDLGNLDPNGNPIIAYGYTRHPDWSVRNEEAQQFAQTWYVNATRLVHVTMYKLLSPET